MKAHVLALALLTTNHFFAQVAFAQAVLGRLDRIESNAPPVGVQIVNGAGKKLAEAGYSFSEGDHLITNSDQTAFITLRDESQLVVGPLTELAIDEVGSKGPETKLRLVYGFLHNIVKKIYSDDHPYTVQTPTSVMGVRGTEFVVEHDSSAGESSVHTLEGNVAMARSREELRRPNAFHVISAGNMTSMRRGMSTPLAPRAFDHAAFSRHLNQRSPALMRHLQRTRPAHPLFKKPMPQHAQPPARPRPVANRPAARRPMPPRQRPQPAKNQKRPARGKHPNAR